MYLLKEEASKEIKNRYKVINLGATIGICRSYVIQMVNRKRKVSKPVAYAFTKCINSDYEIEDLFERV